MNNFESKAGWPDFADIYSHLRSPLRPCENDVAIMRNAISGRDSDILLLGTTPELFALSSKVIAVEGSMRMINENVPASNESRRAVRANWLALPARTASIDVVVGDGSLNSVGDMPALLKEIERILQPGGIGVFRAFCSPESSESLDTIWDDIQRCWSGNFHALKWRVAMSLAAEETDWQVPVRNIWTAFNNLFPDRQALQSTTGWSSTDIKTIDYYEHAGHSLTFPPASRFHHMISRVFPSIQFIMPTGYPLAERCPTIIMTK